MSKKKKTITRQERQAAKRKPDRFRDIWPTLSEKKRFALFQKTGRNKIQSNFFNLTDWSKIPIHIKTDLALAYQNKLDMPIRKPSPFIIPAYILKDCDRIKIDAERQRRKKIVYHHADSDENIREKFVNEIVDNFFHYHGTKSDIQYICKEFNIEAKINDSNKVGEFEIEIIKINTSYFNLEDFLQTIDKLKTITTSYSIKMAPNVIREELQKSHQHKFAGAFDGLLASPSLADYSAEDLRQAILAFLTIMDKLGSMLQPLLDALGKIVQRHVVQNNIDALSNLSSMLNKQEPIKP